MSVSGAPNDLNNNAIPNPYMPGLHGSTSMGPLTMGGYSSMPFGSPSYASAAPSYGFGLPSNNPALPPVAPSSAAASYYGVPSSSSHLSGMSVPSTSAGHVVVAGGPSVYGTEKDKYNCPFFIKTGACRHGDKCNRFHPRPNSSVTILIPHLFLNMNAHILKDNVGNEYRYTTEQLQKRVDEFFEDVWMEIMQFGEIVELIICRNTCEQLLGNVYIKFVDEASAQRAMLGLQNRSFEGRLVLAEFSPVLDFVEACCKQNTDGQCKFREKDLCNFIHTEMPSTRVVERCMRAQITFWKKRLKNDSGSAEGMSGHMASNTVAPTPYFPHGAPMMPDMMFVPPSMGGMPSGYGMPEVSGAPVCFYCGDPSHTINECPYAMTNTPM